MLAKPTSEIFDTAFIEKIKVAGSREITLTAKEKKALRKYRRRYNFLNKDIPKPDQLMFGEPIYMGGPAILERFELDIPPEITRLQLRIFSEAFALYIPPDKLMAFQREFFHGPYWQSDEMLERTRWMSFLKPHKHSFIQKPKPDHLSFDLDHPDRQTRHRELYTDREAVYSLEQSVVSPIAALAIISYFDSMRVYAKELGANVAPFLPDKQKANLDVLIKQFESPAQNGIYSILPAVFISMKNNGRAEPAAEDFDRAFKFANENGAFLNHVKRPNAEVDTAKFHCPAQMMLIKNARGDAEAHNVEEDTPAISAGMIYRIYTDLKSKVASIDDPLLDEQILNIKRRASGMLFDILEDAGLAPKVPAGLPPADPKKLVP